jgi:hypothetical protein
MLKNKNAGSGIYRCRRIAYKLCHKPITGGRPAQVFSEEFYQSFPAFQLPSSSVILPR